MSIHLQKDLKKIEKKILNLTTLVEEAFTNSITAFRDGDAELAKEIIENDNLVDEIEIEVEEDCLKILALHQPVAIDLRFIVAILKINSDLERIGDHATSIAKRVLSIGKLKHNSEAHLTAIFAIADQCRHILKMSIDSLINQDSRLAMSVIEQSYTISDERKVIVDKLLDEATDNPEGIRCYHHQLFITRFIDRVADHAVNIAEDVIYMSSGDIVRHQDILNTKK